MAEPGHRSVLVVGAGASGLAAARDLADSGLGVIVVEEREGPGGEAARLRASAGDPVDPAAAVADLVRSVVGRPGIEYIAPARLVSLEGHAGGLVARIEEGGRTIERKAAAAIAATGAAREEPGAGRPWIGLGDLESLVHGTEAFPASVGFLADPAEIGEALSQHAILDACLARERKGARAYVFLANVPVAGAHGQALYDRALGSGVVFFRSARVSVRVEDGAALIEGEDEILRRPFSIRCDLVVRSGAGRPSAAAARALGLGIEEGSMAPANVTFLPGRTAREGVFVAGSCAGETDVAGAMRSGRMAALEARRLVDVLLPARKAGDVEIRSERCASCLTCLRICPYGAVSVGPGDRYPAISDSDCHDCGLCAAACPQRTITFHCRPEDAILGEAGKGASVALFCERSMLAVREARDLGLALPASVRILEVPCAACVSTNLVMALLGIVERVAVVACPVDNCRNRLGSPAAERRVGYVRDVLGRIGADPDRVTFHAVAANMPHLVAERLAALA